MSRSIKVSDEVYEDLIGLQRPRESFSEEVARLLRVYRTLFDVSELLGPHHYLAERPLVNADSQRRDIDARTLGGAK